MGLGVSVGDLARVSGVEVGRREGPVGEGEGTVEEGVKEGVKGDFSSQLFWEDECGDSSAVAVADHTFVAWGELTETSFPHPREVSTSMPIALAHTNRTSRRRLIEALFTGL